VAGCDGATECFRYIGYVCMIPGREMMLSQSKFGMIESASFTVAISDPDGILVLYGRGDDYDGKRMP
jgi:hypothetical protein